MTPFLERGFPRTACILVTEKQKEKTPKTGTRAVLASYSQLRILACFKLTTNFKPQIKIFQI